MNQSAASMQPTSVVVFRDGLGERRRVTDSTGRESLDLLCLNGEMIALAAFEAALRERAGRLSDFRHPAFGDLRGVERLSGGTVAVVADAVPGIRLADLLAGAVDHRLTLDINAALCLIRQLVPAIEALHEHNRDIVHGALGIERIVITPRARLVVVDHALGSALEQLHYSHQRYWKDLRVALPRSAGQPKFDARVDVTQIGVVALSLILGRPLTDDEYPAKLPELVASAWAIGSSGDLEPLKPGLRAWLSRALQIDLRNAFSSVSEAGAELDRVLSADGDGTVETASLQGFLVRYDGATTPAHAPVHAPAPSVIAPAAHVVPTPAASPIHVAHVAPGPVAVPPPAVRLVPPPSTAPPSKAYTQAPMPVHLPAPAPAPALAHTETPVPPVATAKSAPVPDPEFDLPQLQHEPRRPLATAAPPVAVAHVPSDTKPSWPRYAVAAVVLVALTVGGLIAVRRRASASGAAADTGTLTISSNPAAAQLLVDGRLAGMTPTTLTLPQGTHTLTLRASGTEARTMSVNVSAGTQASQYIELPRTEIRGETTSGRLQVRTDPPGAAVSVDSIPRGASPVTIGNLAPGDHTVVVSANGNSVQQSVTVDAGMTSALVVPLVTHDKALLSGWIAIASPIDVQLYEGGKLLGSNQTDKIMVASGTHQIELVNETLGYRATRNVSVAPADGFNGHQRDSLGGSLGGRREGGRHADWQPAHDDRKARGYVPSS